MHFLVFIYFDVRQHRSKWKYPRSRWPHDTERTGALSSDFDIFDYILLTHEDLQEQPLVLNTSAKMLKE